MPGIQFVPWAPLLPSLRCRNFNQYTSAHARKPKKKKKRNEQKQEQPVAARRINPDTNVSVKRQIAYVRRFEDLAEAPRKAQKQRQRYRKAPKTAAEAREEIDERRRVDAFLSRGHPSTTTSAPGLASMYGTRRTESSPVLLVDGYNVLSFHAKLKRLRAHGDMERARGKLHSMLTVFATQSEVQVAVVWDAMGASDSHEGDGKWCDVTGGEDGGLVVIWARRAEADTVIVRAVRSLLQRGARYVVVATNDAQEAMLCRGEGATCLNPGELMKGISAAKRGLDREVESINAVGRAAAVPAFGGGVLASVCASDLDGVVRLKALMTGFKSEAEEEEAELLGQSAEQFYGARRRRSNKSGPSHDTSVGTPITGKGEAFKVESSSLADLSWLLE